MYIVYLSVYMYVFNVMYMYEPHLVIQYNYVYKKMWLIYSTCMYTIHGMILLIITKTLQTIKHFSTCTLTLEIVK